MLYYARIPFGLATEFVGLANFARVLGDPAYLNSLRVTAVFSFWTAFLSMAIALMLAVQAENPARRTLYRTLMIWLYAVAAAIAGMLWLFLFNPYFGTLAWPLRQLGVAWDPLLDGGQAMALVMSGARGSRSATTSCSSSRACRRSRSRYSRRRQSTAQAERGGSGP